MTVIPTIMWGAPDTFEYCFDGFPTDSIVSVSTDGSAMSDERSTSFMTGYNEMLDRLNPSGIIVHGRVFDGMKGNIICQIDTMTSQIKRRIKENGLK